MDYEQTPPRRVLLAGAPDTHRVYGVRAALARAWGDGQAVLVTSGSRCLAERYAARLWRRWGGQVQRADRSWSLHHGRSSARVRRWDTPAWQRPAAPDLSIQLDDTRGIRLAEHDRTLTALSDARAAMHRHHHRDHDGDHDGGVEQRTPERAAQDTDTEADGWSDW